MNDHLMKSVLFIFVEGPHCLWCSKSRWSPPLGAFITLKISKNKLEMRKWRPLEIGGGCHFYRKCLTELFIAYFLSPQKLLKYYFIFFRVKKWFVKFKMTISKQFKSPNLNQKKLRKLCTDEVGKVKMKKMKKIHVL